VKRALQRGDYVEIHWIDIQESPAGDPAEAYLAQRKSLGVFWEYKDESGVPVLVTTTTVDADGETGQTGWCIYPTACVQSIRTIRRARKPKK